MKHLLMLVLAFVIVYVLWHIVSAIVSPILVAAIYIGMLVAFCYAVYAVYRLLTREKQIL